jgi:hypothetical protein
MDESTPPKKTLLENLQAIATIFSLVAIPLIVSVVGFYIQQSSTESAAKSKLTELAIDILKHAPDRNYQPGLRAWAVDMPERTFNSIAFRPRLFSSGQIGAKPRGFSGTDRLLTGDMDAV